MALRNKSKELITAVFICFLFVSSGRPANIPQMPKQYVVDQAGIINDTVKNRLDGYLQELEQKTTAQLVVLTIKDLGGESIEDLSIRIANDQWKLGQKGKDNGVLFLIALNDRKYRIEVGYGLEGVLPDSLVGSLGRKLLVPYFKKGDYSDGIFATTLALANIIAKHYGVKIQGMPALEYRTQPSTRGSPAGPFSTIIAVIFFIIMGILFVRNPRAFLLFLLFSSMGGR
ncbi:MAG: TPM domain-containing protein [Desulfobacterales bacterium]